MSKKNTFDFKKSNIWFAEWFETLAVMLNIDLQCLQFYVT